MTSFEDGQKAHEPRHASGLKKLEKGRQGGKEKEGKEKEIKTTFFL